MAGHGSEPPPPAASAQSRSFASRPVPAHLLPHPTTVSAELQARIAAGAKIAPVNEIPTTNAGWDALYNPTPRANRKRIDGLLDEHALRLEERTIAGVHCFAISPREDLREDDCLLVNFHGGGYVGGAGEAGLNEALYVSAVGRRRIIAVDYRMPPNHPYPAAVDDAAVVWQELSEVAPPRQICLFGTSAGGGIILCLLQRLIAAGEPVPGAIVCGTPWSDLSETGDSYFAHKYADDVTYAGSLHPKALQYAAGLALDDPRVSPVYGDFSGFPPTLLISGTRDLFLSNTVRVERKLRDAGCDVGLVVYEGQSHGRYLSGLDVPETRTAAHDMNTFFARKLDKPRKTGNAGQMQ